MAVRNFSRPWSRRLQNRRTRSIYGPSFKVSPFGDVINDADRALGIDGDGRTVPDSSYGLWRGSTNLITNGGSETTTGWSGGTRDITEYKFGTASTKIAGGVGPTYPNVTVSPSTVYTCSLWFKCPSTTSLFIQLDWRDSGGGFISSVSSSTVQGNGSWQRITFTTTTSPGTAASVDIRINPGTGTDDYYLDGVQFEQQPYATPYIHTDGAIASRVSSYVTAPTRVVNATQGWIAVRYRLHLMTPGFQHWLAAIYSDANHYSAVGFLPSALADRIYFEAKGVEGTFGNSGMVRPGAGNYSEGDVITVIMAWTGGNNVKASLDGQSFLALGPAVTLTTITQVKIGDLIGASDAFADGEILWATAGTGTLSDTDAATIHAKGNTDDATNWPTLSAATFFWSADTDGWVVPTLATGTPYTETGTINLKLSPNTAVETIAAVESNTARLSFTVSAAETRQETDAATAALLFTASAVDISVLTESNTALVTLTANAAEAADLVESNTVPLSLTASAAEVAVLTESNTALVTFTPSSADVYERSDANTALVTLTPSVVEAVNQVAPVGGIINDVIRTANIYGDGRTAPDSSYGLWRSSTNLIPNGGFETNTTGWGGTGLSGRITSDSKFGTACYQLVAAANGDGLYNPSAIPASPSTTYTFSAWVKAAAGTGLRIRLDTNAGATNNLTVMLADGTWQRFSITATTTPTDTGVQVLIQTGAYAGGSFGNFKVDGIQLERQPYATPYIHTDGATASRVDGYVQVPNRVLNATQGWVAVRYRLHDVMTGADHPVIDYYADGSNLLRYTYVAPTTPNGNDGGIVAQNSGGNTFRPLTAPQDNDIITGIMRWTSSNIGDSLNGSTFNNYNTPGGRVGNFGFRLGANFSNIIADGEILWAACGTGTLSDSDAAAIHAKGNTDDPTNWPSLSAATMFWSADTDAWVVPTLATGAVYTETGTVTIKATPSSADVAALTDATTAAIVFTPSAAETREEVDTATVALLFTPSVAELREATDSNTASVVFTVSSTAEVAAFIDSATTSIALTPSTAELAQFTDSSTATVTFTPGTAELREVTDSNTALVSFTPSAAETRGVTDSNTGTITFTPSSSDVAVLVDSNTSIVTFTPSSTVETVQDVDAATGVVTFTPSISDVGVFTDTNTASVLFSPSSAELRERTDSATSTLALTPSSTVETAQYVDSNTGVVTLTPSTAEIAQEVDAATGIVTFTPSSADIFVGTDAATSTLVLTVSSTETYIPAFAGTDAATAILALTPSGTVEIVQDVDARTVALGLVPSTAEIASFIDATTGVLVFTVSSAEVLVATDAATSVVNLVPSSADVQAFAEANTVAVQLVPSSNETAALTDSATTNLLFTVSALESVVHIYADADTVQLNLLVSSADVGTFVEASVVYLLLGPLSTDDVLASIDAITVNLNLSISGTDLLARDIADQATALLLFTPNSAVELTEHTDANTALLLFTPSAFISVGTEDEATVNLVFTPTFLTSVQDVGTVVLVFSVSGTEVGVIVKTLLSAIFIGQKWSIRSRGTRTSCAGLDARYAAINRG